MKALGFAVLLAGVVIGAGLLANFVSRLSRAECTKTCPANKAALKVYFSQPPIEFALCRCGKVRSSRAGH